MERANIDSLYVRVVVGLDTLGHQAAPAGGAEGVLNTLLGEGVFRHGPLTLLKLHVLVRDVDEQVAVAHADGAVAAADAGRRVVEWRGDGDAVGDGAAVAGRIVGCRGRGFCCCCCCCDGGGGGGCVVTGGAGGHGGVGGGEERGRK